MWEKKRMREVVAQALSKSLRKATNKIEWLSIGREGRLVPPSVFKLVVLEKLKDFLILF
jgi:hypothetical protein